MGILSFCSALLGSYRVSDGHTPAVSHILTLFNFLFNTTVSRLSGSCSVWSVFHSDPSPEQFEGRTTILPTPKMLRKAFASIMILLSSTSISIVQLQPSGGAAPDLQVDARGRCVYFRCLAPACFLLWFPCQITSTTQTFYSENKV